MKGYGAVNDDTYVIVPVYNEAPVVRKTVDELLARFAHVVCVDDGSSDGSAQRLHGSGATVLRHAINLGQGGALRTGLDYALARPDARYFVTFDADGQHRVEDAERMLQVARESGSNVVFGSRFAERGSGPRGARRVALRLGTAYTNLTTGLRLTDTHNGLRVLDRRFAESLALRSADMAHASEIIAHAARGDFAVTEVATTILYTDYSRSKGQPLMNGVNILVDTIVDAIRGERP